MLRLKVSPKTAIELIDTMISRGDKLLQFGRDILPPDNISCMQILSKIEFEDIGFECTKPREIEPKWMGAVFAWVELTRKELLNIFLDYTPQYLFGSAGEGVSKDIPPNETNVSELSQRLKAKLEILQNFYVNLMPYFRVPFLYLPEKGELWFYDMVCPIQGKKQSDLCAFMFDRDIGRFYEFEEIYAYMSGETEGDKWPKNWTKEVNHAIEGVNKKTKDRWERNLFSIRERHTLGINIPKGLIVSDI